MIVYIPMSSQCFILYGGWRWWWWGCINVFLAGSLDKHKGKGQDQASAKSFHGT